MVIALATQQQQRVCRSGERGPVRATLCLTRLDGSVRYELTGSAVGRDREGFVLSKVAGVVTVYAGGRAVAVRRASGKNSVSITGVANVPPMVPVRAVGVVKAVYAPQLPVAKLGDRPVRQIDAVLRGRPWITPDDLQKILRIVAALRRLGARCDVRKGVTSYDNKLKRCCTEYSIGCIPTERVSFTPFHRFVRVCRVPRYVGRKVCQMARRRVCTGGGTRRVCEPRRVCRTVTVPRRVCDRFCRPVTKCITVRVPKRICDRFCRPVRRCRTVWTRRLVCRRYGYIRPFVAAVSPVQVLAAAPGKRTYTVSVEAKLATRPLCQWIREPRRVCETVRECKPVCRTVQVPQRRCSTTRECRRVCRTVRQPRTVCKPRRVCRTVTVPRRCRWVYRPVCRVVKEPVCR